jgi:uroporphyrinogen-III synthase
VTRGLADRRIINTRAPHQAGALDAILRAHGAVPLEYPCIDIVPAEDNTAFDASLRSLMAGDYAWLVLTSINTVLAVARRLGALGLSLAGARVRVAAIGPATREAARELLGVDADIVPEKFVAESLGDAIPVRRGEKVFLPESEIARPVLAEMLRARGAGVDVVVAYHTGRGRGGADIPSLLEQGAVDAVTFTSTSTVTNFLERIGREGGSLPRALGLCAACIGPVTADAARENGFRNIVVPGEYTLAGMTEALEGYFGSGSFRGEDRS